ncbi:DNA mismatch repair endonuclease MutL [Puia dinghuensis]|uniref:DNA mismatch repair protein MutL n=1 Tax=Puia dinghuensis TaxID=1792502 RepID=A0A8J2UFR1_9BACT|nr:DNA mismatch repair endonuclease MutL [Puia dinghuensis]GGB09289.1 DNA mismatch repair protein MutL [Puia dinghuensis]
MADIIHLLPDNIANQIAAGEVIQRPASAVKELMENAVDAGATDIRLYVQDAGKALVQVVDNGKGMSETDARMAFERHATSKIKEIDDLFHIKTMGFRGEALASIAAVAQVELKTRRQEDETGTLLEIENSRVVRQEPAALPVGSSVAMKNLFFNVPARRNFLKSNTVEMRHILDEFNRVALSFPAIFFSLTGNGQQLMHLEKGSLKQRVVQILGNSYTSKLVSVQENTDYLNIYGFVGKPDTAKKTRGDQYFFVNNRFIRSAYLNHAVNGAFAEMIPRDSFPLYVLFIDLDPTQVDINVHPTKQEIKFEDEKIVYAFVQAAVKHALAQFSITPTLDFDLDPNIQGLDAVSKPVSEEKKASVASSSLYRTFTQKNQAHFIEPTNKSELRHWKDFYEAPATGGAAPVAKDGNVSPAGGESEAAQGSGQPKEATPAGSTASPGGNTQAIGENAAMGDWAGTAPTRITPIEKAPLQQLLNTYIVTPTNRSFILVHQAAAHERILYESYKTAATGHPIASQKSLFPATLTLSAPDAVLLTGLLPDLQLLGYTIEPFGKDTFIIQGTPADTGQGNEKGALEDLLEQYKNFVSEIRFSKREQLVRTLARQNAIKPGTALTEKEMRALVDDLFACAQHNVTPGGDPTYIEFKKDYVEKLFGRY